MKIMLDPDAYMPERAYDEDAGLDLRSTRSVIVPALGSVVIETGVHVELPPWTAGVLISKSGLNVKHGITSTGLIDEGYTGEIKIKLYNHNPFEDYFVHKGDKISQLVIVPIIKPEITVVDHLDGAARGDNGFGSSGR